MRSLNRFGANRSLPIHWLAVGRFSLWCENSTRLGEWFIATNVPVVLLDIYSPEGGTVDGIIGMNLFTEFNLVLRGGGLFLQESATFEFEPIHRIIADIAPEGGDGIVNGLDLEVFLQAWLSEGTMPPSPNWNRKADMAPISEPDDKVDFLDYSILADHWLETAP